RRQPRQHPAGRRDRGREPAARPALGHADALPSHVSRPGVLLTGVGKRYDIVSAFAQHAFVVAADPSPLAPAQYAADVRVAPPRADSAQYIPFLSALCEEQGVVAVVPLTDLDLEALARSGLPAFVPDAEV